MTAVETPLSDIRLVKPDAVMRLLGYADRSAFWVAVRAARVPFIKINARRCLFEEAAVRRWLESRTIGKVEL